MHKCQLCGAFLVFVNTYIAKSPLSYHPPTHGNDADAKESYCEPLGQCLPCLSLTYPRRELGHPALRSTAKWKGLAPPSAHLAPLGRKNFPAGSGIGRDSFSCSTNLAPTPKRTVAKGVLLIIKLVC